MTEQLLLDRWNEPDYISALSKNSELIRSFSELSNCNISTIEEALRLRRETWEIIALWTDTEIEREAIFDGWYNIFQVPKSDGRFRTISEPAPTLKAIQSEIKARLLSEVEIFSWAFWWEKWRSYIDNARYHRNNQPRYMVNLDLANAFPSVDSRRLFVNLRSALRKKIDMSLPGLSEDERDSLIDLLVIMMSYNWELPQWASTSPRALNIVLWKVDQRIVEFVSSIAWLHSPKYTRYVDDLTISWKEFNDIMPIWWIRKEATDFLDSIWKRNTELDSEQIHSDITKVNAILERLESVPFLINSRKQRWVIIKLIIRVQEFLDSFNIFVHSGSQDELVGKLDLLKARVRNFRYSIEQSKIWNQIEGVADWVKKILIQEGWKVNENKSRINTPASKKQMIVTWVSIDRQWNLWIPNENEKEIQMFLERAIIFPHTLPLDCRWNDRKIAEKIEWYRNYILSVRWRLNRKLQSLFNDAQSIYTPDRDYAWKHSMIYSPV